MKKQTKKTKSAEIIAICLSLAILIIGGYMIYAYNTKIWPYEPWFEPTVMPDDAVYPPDDLPF